jgi:uncharacterized delta-60 repeat protein
MRYRLPLALLAASLSTAALASWPNIFSAPDGQLEIPTKMAVDSQGNVFICGYAYPGSSSDFLTLKFNRFGILKWARYYGSTDKQESASALALDSDGNVYVTGSGRGASDDDIITIKYSPNGVEQWVRTVVGPGASTDSAVAIATTAQGKIVVTGLGQDGSDNNILTTQYSADGALEWSEAYSTPGDHADLVDAMAVDANGNVFLTGRLHGNGNDFGVLRYDSAGNLQWVRKVRGTMSEGSDAGHTIAVDSEGNVVAFGSVQASSGLSDFLTIKYNLAGQKLWQAKGGSANYDETGVAMRLDSGDNIIVTGQRTGAGGVDVLTMKYNSAGARLWSKVYDDNGGAITTDAIKGLEVDDAGNVFVGLQCLNADFSRRYGMVKYTSAGTRIFVRFNGLTTTNSSAPITMALDRTLGRAFLTGNGYNPASFSYDIYTVRY